MTAKLPVPFDLTDPSLECSEGEKVCIQIVDRMLSNKLTVLEVAKDMGLPDDVVDAVWERFQVGCLTEDPETWVSWQILQ
jgi:hypothetical protein